MRSFESVSHAAQSADSAIASGNSSVLFKQTVKRVSGGNKVNVGLYDAIQLAVFGINCRSDAMDSAFSFEFLGFLPGILGIRLEHDNR